MEWIEIAQQLHHNELVNLLICNFDNICRLCILYLFYQKYILMVKISTFVFGIRWKLNRSCEIMGFSTWLYSRFSLKFVILPIEPFRPTLTILLPNSHPRWPSLLNIEKRKCQILLKANYFQQWTLIKWKIILYYFCCLNTNVHDPWYHPNPMISCFCIDY